MKKVYKSWLLACLILLFSISPVITYASQNHSRTEDNQTISLEIIESTISKDKDSKEKENSNSFLPKTGEKMSYLSLLGFSLILVLVLLYLLRTKREANVDAKK